MKNQYEIDYQQGYDTANDEWLERMDKMRAEIRGVCRVILKGTSEDDWAVKWNQCLDEVLQIMEKYTAESEE